MKQCNCGGNYQRHGKTYIKQVQSEAMRYRCAKCRSVINVLSDGNVFKGMIGRQPIADWRHE